MATPIHQNHAANIVEKTIRWVDALDVAGALGVPQKLIELGGQGDVGRVLADAGWDHLAEMVAKVTGRVEVAPISTRKAIADGCARKRTYLDAPANDPFAHYPG